MASEWPADWIRLRCPNGHELQTYDSVVDGRLYCICDICGVPCAFTNIPIDRNPYPVRVILPDPDPKMIDFPPLDLPEE